MNNGPFVEAVVACLAAGGAHQRKQNDALHRRIADLLFDAPAAPDHEALKALDTELRDLAGAPEPLVGLVFGGATKVKDYVFEAPRLPEIRGASALLDWVNTTALRDLWVRELGADFARAGYAPEVAARLAEAAIVYSSGGNFLALAPAGQRARDLAVRIEQTYNDWTFTAQSVGVAIDVPLIGLRYGHDPLAYWVEQFRKDSADPQLAALLTPEYPAAPGQSLDDRFFARKRFGELVSVLSAAFYRRRDQRSFAEGSPLPPSVYPYAPWDERCFSSAIRPAVYRGRIAEDEPEELLLSAPAARRRFVGQILKNDRPSTGDWYIKAEGWRRPQGLPAEGWKAWRAGLTSWEAAWQRWLGREGTESAYARAMRDEPGRQGPVRPPHDVQDIGASAGGYIGLIYADGNRVGGWMQACATPQDYAGHSRALDAATKDAVFRALGEHLAPCVVDGRRVHPFEIITIGGDDILLIVPGDRALPIALTIARSFEQSPALRGADAADTRPAQASPVLPSRFLGAAGADPAEDVGPVAISAGVIIARDNTPIFFLRDLVEELLKSAKAHARDRLLLHSRAEAERRRSNPGGPALALPGGSVDFMALKSISMVTNKIKEYRVRALGQERKQPDATTCRLTARPYSWPELAGLLGTALALIDAHVPRSQLYRIREVLEQTRESGVTASAIEYLYTRSRMRSNHASALLAHVEQAWRGSAQTDTRGSSAPPWLRRATAAEPDAGWETIWPDLIEIYDFVGRPEPATREV